MPQALELGNPFPPELNNDYPVLTLSDCIFRLGERNGSFVGDRTEERMYARAVRDALRDLPSRSQWSYFRRNFQFTTSAPVTRNVTNGTAPAGEFDGGLMRLTITDAETWPDDVAYGEVYIDDTPYAVVRHDSSTNTITLNRASTTFTGEIQWYRKAYAIPRIRKVNGLWDMSNRRPIIPRGIEELSDRNLTYNAPGFVVAYTIRQDNSFSQTEVILNPPPVESKDFLVVGSFEPRHPKIISKVINSPTLVNSRVFTHPEARDSWVGSVIRINEDSGDAIEDIRLGEYTSQFVVWSVEGTTVTVTSDLPSDFEDQDIYISSMVDIDIPVMQTYFDALCYEYYCRNTQAEDYSRAVSMANKLYLEARGADNKWDPSTQHHPFWSYGWELGGPDTSFPVVIT